MHCTRMAGGPRDDPRHEPMGITEPHVAPIRMYEFTKKTSSGELLQRIKVQGGQTIGPNYIVSRCGSLNKKPCRRFI